MNIYKSVLRQRINGVKMYLVHFVPANQAGKNCISMVFIESSVVFTPDVHGHFFIDIFTFVSKVGFLLRKICSQPE